MNNLYTKINYVIFRFTFHSFHNIIITIMKLVYRNCVCSKRFISMHLSNNQLIIIITHAGLNSLQSGLHKPYMRDLFVELCLTVPVRLSSLLPYLPMLMDPLVSALNGSQNLVSQVSIEPPPLI